jgi:hypothetical protein
MVRIITNAKSLRQQLIITQKDILKGVDDVLAKTAARTRFIIRAFAPFDSGKLKSKITKKPITKGWRVSSNAKSKTTGFPYHHWVNERPIRSVNLWNKGQQVQYSQTNHTGVPGYFDKGVVKSAEILKAELNKRFRKLR